MLTPPPFLELDWREIAQRGVDALVHVDVVQEPAQLADSISIVVVVRQVNFLLFDGPDEPLGVAILPSLTTLGHADFGVDSSEHPDVGRGRVLDTLIRVVDFRPVLSQSAIQGDQRQGLVQATAQMPTTDTAGEHVHDHSQVDELVAQSDVGDTCTCSAGASVGTHHSR